MDAHSPRQNNCMRRLLPVRSPLAMKLKATSTTDVLPSSPADSLTTRVLILYMSLDCLDFALPRVSLGYVNLQPRLNHSKLALLIENRPDPILAPLMLHFIAVVPPDWRFRFMGSPESLASITRSVAIRQYVEAGKLELTPIPPNMSTTGAEHISRFLTTLWLYEVALYPAEWLLVFQTDSMLCANSRLDLDDFLEYDWIGAPWNPEGRWGGNGGLSLRRVSAMTEVLRHQVRIHGSEPEDVWLAERVAHRPGARVANGTVSLTFSGEYYPGEKVQLYRGGGEDESSSLEAAAHGQYVPDIDAWREGFYEPMGYHTGGSGRTLHSPIWGTPALRKHIWDYCPEIKMILEMDAAQYVPGNCNSMWKRGVDDEGVEDGVREDDRFEVIDGEVYPLLPPELVAW